MVNEGPREGKWPRKEAVAELTLGKQILKEALEGNFVLYPSSGSTLDLSELFYTVPTTFQACCHSTRVIHLLGRRS